MEDVPLDWLERVSEEDIALFLQDADEQLQLLDGAVVRLEREPVNPELLQAVFRGAHTLKGSAGMLGYRQMAELAHSMEGTLDRLRKGAMECSPAVCDSLLRGLDGLRLLREALASRREPGLDLGSLLEEMEAAGQGRAQERRPGRGDAPPLELAGPQAARLRELSTLGRSGYRVRVSLARETPWASVRCFQLLAELSEMGEVLRSSPTREEVEQEEAGPELEAIVASPQEGEAIARAARSVADVEAVEVVPYAAPAEADRPAPRLQEAEPHHPEAQTIRVDVARLDHLMNTIGELVIERTRMVQVYRALERAHREDDLVQALGKSSATMVKVVDSLQQSAMQMRMLPIGTVFAGFPRLVRDLARKAGKGVDLRMEGQETEIDRTVIERIRDPLVHLLRNAVDHGVEGPEERRRAGKPEAGEVRLSAYQEQGYIVIAVEDDGRGIDPRRLREAAVRKGLVSPEAASRLSDAEAVDLVFLPGASTAERATEVSGRGVGMDIVKTNIEAIHGSVSLDTRLGQGTRFTLRLPLTLATLQALLVSLGEAVYAVPLVYVLEAVRLEPGEVHTVGGREVMRLRDRVLPLLRLGDALALGSAGHAKGEPTCAIVVRFGERQAGLAVGALMESQEIVVKALGRSIGEVRGIMGASILGDGRVVLILDVPGLMSASLARAA